MQQDDQLSTEIRELIIDICEVLYHRGYTVIPVGALMRLVGVDPAHAQAHDDAAFELDDDFETMLQQRKQWSQGSGPDGVTLH